MQNHHIIFFYSVLPDTNFEADFRLIDNATGLLCNSILPVVDLYFCIPYCKYNWKVIVIVYELYL